MARSPRARRALDGLTCGVLLVLAGTAGASTPIPLTLEQLAVDAEMIVVGTVVDQSVRFNDAATLILTHTTIDVDEVVAGEAPRTLQVSEYGGQIGDVGLVVPGLPTYEHGERVLLFLRHDILNLLRTSGARQGKLALRTAGDGTTRASGEMAGVRIDARLPDLRARIRAARNARR